MEDTEVIDADLNPENKIDISEIYSLIESISRWTRFLSIIGFVWVAFFVILGLSFSSGLSLLGTSSNSTTYPSSFFSILYFIVALLLLLPIIYLYRFSVISGKAIKTGSNASMVHAFFNLRAHYKYIGILAIVTSMLYVFSMAGLLAGYFYNSF